MAYGKFPSFDDFLESYKASTEEQFASEIAGKTRDLQIEMVKKKTKNRDVVEVNAVIADHLPDEGQHYHLLIHIESVKEPDPDVAQDLDRCMSHKENVFVAIRYGDNMGISEPIVSGISKGDKLDIKGEWIPRDKAYSHGGERMSVLHFTHHPLGFICTETKCYH